MRKWIKAPFSIYRNSTTIEDSFCVQEQDLKGGSFKAQTGCLYYINIEGFTQSCFNGLLVILLDQILQSWPIFLVKVRGVE